MKTLATQVLIVGAGPACLATPIGLAQHGTDMITINALPEAQNMRAIGGRRQRRCWPNPTG